MNFSFDIFGLPQLILFFKLMSQKVDFGEAWVGSAVAYGPMQEFGTQFITERPHWRVALPEVIGQIGGDAKLHDEILDAFVEFDPSGGAGVGEIEAGTTAPAKVALLVERRVKQIMTAKRIIDTGNYRASVATGRTEEDAFGKSKERMFVLDFLDEGI